MPFKIKKKIGLMQWLLSLTIAIHEVEIRRMAITGQPRQYPISTSQVW
jgi:hypothetical protein